LDSLSTKTRALSTRLVGYGVFYPTAHLDELGLAPEQVLGAFAPEQELAGLAPQQVDLALPLPPLRALSDEYLRSLSSSARQRVSGKVTVPRPSRCSSGFGAAGVNVARIKTNRAKRRAMGLLDRRIYDANARPPIRIPQDGDGALWAERSLARL
jgi:hypothetical protein